MDGTSVGGNTAERDAGRVVWAPQPGPQTLLLTCPIADILFGGARGGGKSDALLGDFIAHASRSNGWARGLMLRRTTPQLEEIVARAKQIFPAIGAKWVAGTKTWVMPCGSTLKMRWMDRDEDADIYQGHSYTWIGVDEAGTWPDPAPIDKLRATLRSPKSVKCVMRATANPGGPGHQWLKERYVMPAKPLTPFYDAARLTHRVFIPSRIRDNKKLIEADPSYVDRLKASGPPWLVRAWLNGDWDASAGEAFFSEAALLENGMPVEYPAKCDMVFAVVDTAAKDGAKHDGTACIWFAVNLYTGTPLIILDYDYIQIPGDMLENWLPTVSQRCEHLARQCQARRGDAGVYIEDAGPSGIVLNQQATRRGINAQPIDTKLTSMGKEARAISVSGYVYQDKVKISRHAFEKVVTFKDQSRNHLLGQVCGFQMGQKIAHDDLLDCFTYGLSISLGDGEGW